MEMWVRMGMGTGMAIRMIEEEREGSVFDAQGGLSVHPDESVLRRRDNRSELSNNDYYVVKRYSIILYHRYHSHTVSDRLPRRVCHLAACRK